MHFSSKTMKIIGIIASLAGFALGFLEDHCKEVEANERMAQEISDGISKELARRNI